MGVRTYLCTTKTYCMSTTQLTDVRTIFYTYLTFSNLKCVSFNNQTINHQATPFAHPYKKVANFYF